MKAQKFRTFTLQDGTNSILKLKEDSAGKLFENFEELVQMIDEKFKPEKFFICEVPPVVEDDNYRDVNSKIDEFNALIHQKYSASEHFSIVNINQSIKRIDNWSYIYHKNVHLNDQQGVPFLKILLLANVLPYSNNEPRAKKRYYHSSAYQTTNYAANNYGAGNYNYTSYPQTYTYFKK